LRFRTTVKLEGKTATGLPVPPEVVEALGSGKRPAVTVTVGGHTYRSTIALMGGVFMLPLSAERRTAAGVAAGDEVDVDVELDTAPRTVDVPADLAKAMDAATRKAFDALSYSNQRAIVLSVDGAKAAETRQRRIDKAVDGLGG
jgi:hypothetical protein